MANNVLYHGAAASAAIWFENAISRRNGRDVKVLKICGRDHRIRRRRYIIFSRCRPGLPTLPFYDPQNRNASIYINACRRARRAYSMLGGEINRSVFRERIPAVRCV